MPLCRLIAIFAVTFLSPAVRLWCVTGFITLPANGVCVKTSACAKKELFNKKITRSWSKIITTRRSFNNNGANDKESTSKSIGEVVGGLHGGKYQFNDFGAPGLSYAGQQFTESLYGSAEAGYEGDDSDLEKDELWPLWAIRMQPPFDQGNDTANDGVVVLSLELNSSNGMDGILCHSTIRIQNDERTWERYYAKIMCRDIDYCDSPQTDSFDMESLDGQERWRKKQTTLPFIVEPKSGFLAPRGGANNACDASKPYDDSAVLKVYYNSQSEEILDEKKKQWWLVAGTEEEKWFFKLYLRNAQS